MTTIVRRLVVFATVVVLAFVIGLALGHWWPDRDPGTPPGHDHQQAGLVVSGTDVGAGGVMAGGVMAAR